MTVKLQRLNLRHYAYTVGMGTRYGDFDCHGHMHEIAIGRLFEALRYARLSFLFGPGESEAFESVTGRMVVHRLQPGRFEGVIVGAASISRIGTSSFEWATALFHEGSCFALSEMTQIVVDQNFRPRTIPASVRERLTTLVNP